MTDVLSPGAPPELIYLDHQASTPVDPRVIDVMVRTLQVAVGNPNSVDHAAGAYALRLVNDASKHVAKLVGCQPHQVVFTSGSSEGLALALAHAHANRSHGRPLRVAATPVEHRALLDLLADGEREGRLQVRWLRVDDRARLDLADLNEALCCEVLDLVCVMAANNEVGTSYPIEHIGRAATESGVPLLVDATQSVGRETMQAERWGVTYLTLSAHKMYGPKGVGALVTTVPSPPSRRGTPNVPAIVGFGEAARLRLSEMADDEHRIRMLRDRLQAILLELVDGLVVNGDQECRLTHNLHISVPGLPNDAVTARLHDSVAISTGAACASGVHQSSHVLRAMCLPEEVQEGALRISLGKFTTAEQVDRAAVLIAGAVMEVRRLSGKTLANPVHDHHHTDGVRA